MYIVEQTHAAYPILLILILNNSLWFIPAGRIPFHLGSQSKQWSPGWQEDTPEMNKQL